MYGVHEDNTKCLDCYDNYYQPNENGKCVIDLCAYYEDGTCEECFEYFYLDENGNCMLNVKIAKMDLHLTKKLKNVFQIAKNL